MVAAFTIGSGGGLRALAAPMPPRDQPFPDERHLTDALHSQPARVSWRPAQPVRGRMLRLVQEQVAPVAVGRAVAPLMEERRDAALLAVRALHLRE
eukprot:11327765-Alexandrium_andersonii.AAC.1